MSQTDTMTSPRTWRRPHQVTIGELLITGDTITTQRSPIEAWEGYGVVCYPLGTLNGSIPAMARNLVAMLAEVAQMRRELEDPSYTVQATLDGQQINHLDVERTIDQLSALYQRQVMGAVRQERREVIDTIIASHAKKGRKPPTRLAAHGIDEASYTYLIAVTASQQGIFLVWPEGASAGDLTEEIYEAIVGEAETAGLKDHYHVHALRNLIFTDDVAWYPLSVQ